MNKFFEAKKTARHEMRNVSRDIDKQYMTLAVEQVNKRDSSEQAQRM